MKSVFYAQVWYKLFLNSRSISNLLLSICIQYDARTITNSNPFISTENFCTFKNILGNIKEISVVICPPRTAGTPKTIYLALIDIAKTMKRLQCSKFRQRDDLLCLQE